MYYKTILRSFQLPRKRPYIPRFAVRAEGPNWRVSDGNRDIALFLPTALDIWAFSPFEPSIIANPEPLGKLLDVHTIRNTWINIAWGSWPRNWLAAGSAEERLRWKWVKSRGAFLEALLSIVAPEGEGGEWRVNVFYDPTWGRYRFVWTIDARKRQPHPMEPFNMLAGDRG